MIRERAYREREADFEDVTITADGHILAVGRSSEKDALIASFTMDGDLEWSRVYGGSGFDGFWGVAAAPNGDIVAVGRTASSDGDFPSTYGQEAALLVRLTSEGDIHPR